MYMEKEISQYGVRPRILSMVPESKNRIAHAQLYLPGSYLGHNIKRAVGGENGLNDEIRFSRYSNNEVKESDRREKKGRDSNSQPAKLVT